MSLQVGIIGMPNVGKSTLLNALTHARAESSNYPFCTIEKNVGVTAIDDPRLRSLAEALHPEEVVPATIQFVDIAGLVRGASKGEGLGNKFLGHVREADALVQVVRAFEDELIVHVDGTVDPVRDFEVVQLELMLADLATVEQHADKVRKQAKGNPKEAAETLELLEEIATSLRAGKPFRTEPERAASGAGDATSGPGAPAGPASGAAAGRSGGAVAGHGHAHAQAHGHAAPTLSPAQILASELFLLSSKPMIVVANCDEGQAAELSGEPPQLVRLRQACGVPVLGMAIRLEEELSRLSPEERADMIRELSLPGEALTRLVEESRRLLGLITFYTIANNKLRAWLVPEGTPAPRAAGRIHTDMERGFIRVEVFNHSDVLAHGGSRAELHKHGLVRTEGKEYLVRDGDVIQVLFQAP